MVDPLQVVAIVFTALLLPGFGHLYLRFRDTRTLLWFFGFLASMVGMFATYKLGDWNPSGALHPLIAATGDMSIQISAALFLASLSPTRFRIGRLRILYVVLFILPLTAVSLLNQGALPSISTSSRNFLVYPALALVALVVTFLWGVANETSPAWVGGAICGAAGLFAFWLLVTYGPTWALISVYCSARLVTAILVVLVFRRFSTGVALSVIGFVLWSFPILGILPVSGYNHWVILFLVRISVLGKVVAALGLILLALEDQLAINKTAQERERRARVELEAYANLILSRRRVEDFDRQAAEICQTVVKHSRFSEAALILQGPGRLHVAGAAGIGAATVKALDALVARIPSSEFLTPGSAPPAVGRSQTFKLDLEPWLEPGDDLRRLCFTRTLAVPMAGRSRIEGALFLAGMRNAQAHHRQPLRADDLLPLEMLTARLQSVRGQTMMLEKLIDSEKFAGLGHLAGNVTQQLNNPLTVILGYASLLEENTSLDPQERRAVEAILTEARRMRSTLESLTRVARSHAGPLAAVSLTELLADVDELYRTEFLHRSIEFQINIAPALPRVLGNAQQLRQAIVQCLQFAMDAVQKQNPEFAAQDNMDKAIRIEATAEGSRVQILVAHSGAGFLHPERAFDPFVPAQAAGETAGLGLSFCATILRENNGQASAVNLEPKGAAIILELQAA